jgi:hypothetical protein
VTQSHITQNFLKESDRLYRLGFSLRWKFPMECIRQWHSNKITHRCGLYWSHCLLYCVSVDQSTMTSSWHENNTPTNPGTWHTHSDHGNDNRLLHLICCSNHEDDPPISESTLSSHESFNISFQTISTSTSTGSHQNINWLTACLLASSNIYYLIIVNWVCEENKCVTRRPTYSARSVPIPRPAFGPWPNSTPINLLLSPHSRLARRCR